MRSALSWSFSSSTTSSTARPAAHETGFPPKVLKNSMPLSKAAAISRVVTTAPSGKPLPIGFPSTTMSGTTPCASKPRSAPQPAEAVCTSSAMATRLQPARAGTPPQVARRQTICPATLGSVSARKAASPRPSALRRSTRAPRAARTSAPPAGRRAGTGPGTCRGARDVHPLLPAAPASPVELVRAHVHEGRGVPMVGVLEDDHILAARPRAGEAQRQLVGLAAGGDEVAHPQRRRRCRVSRSAYRRIVSCR